MGSRLFLCGALVASTTALLCAGSATGSPGSGADHAAPWLLGLRVTNGDSPFAGDGRLVTTVSPNGDSFRDRALLRFSLREPASVRVAVAPSGRRARTIAARSYDLRAGRHVVSWRPRSEREPREYLIRLGVTDRMGNSRAYSKPGEAPVIRVQGVDAAFTRESAKPDAVARLRVETDARALRIELVRAGARRAPFGAPDAYGRVIRSLGVVAWRWVNRPHSLRLRLTKLDSGVYFARLTAADGRIGYAPLVIRPRRLGEHRVAVVVPTQTWQAYNFRDHDGDGWADTWYVHGRGVPLARPYLGWGVPHRFSRYDRPFLRFLDRTGRAADYLSDRDLHRVGSGRELAQSYALVVFPGHHEYVTEHEYDVVKGFRDRGGNLIFLSADNFFWRVRRRGQIMERIGSWRDLGRPEAALVGAQYFRSDGGERRGPWVVRTRLPWLFAGTGLARGSRFSSGGIEADRIAPSSPAGTQVVADIPSLFGPGLSAEMTYYERHGARVFAAGAFTLAAAVQRQPVRRLVENLWDVLARDTDTGGRRASRARESWNERARSPRR